MAGRGAETIGANVLATLFAEEADVTARLEEVARAAILNRNGVIVGGLRPAAMLAELQI
mgnify:CR=1 FL=1